MLRALLVISLIMLSPDRATAADLAFPEDHGPHPNHRIESWYFSGRLSAENEQEFGFHLGFFRLGLQLNEPPQPAVENSAWALREIYRAELGIADLRTGRFQSYQHLSRSGLGLAGTQDGPFRVWVYDWFAETSQSPDSQPGFRLRAAWGGEASLELDIKAAKPAVVPGGQPLMGAGSSRNAMRWYSLTRMVAAGTLKLGEDVHRVKGHVWLDRLWRDASFEFITASLGSTERSGFLSAGQISINRFALLLENGWELLLFQMHRRNGSGTPVPSGTLVYGDGSTRALSRDELVLSETAHWTSSDGRRYPAGWRIAVAADGIDLTVTPSAPDQEVREAVRYWAGAVDVSGDAIGRPVTGHGHVALVGYEKHPDD